MNMDTLQVEVKDVLEKHVICLHHKGPYKGDSDLFGKLFGQLFQWAGARDLIVFPETEMITVYHDNPEETDEDKSWISLCLTASESTEVSGGVEKMAISSGMYAIGHFEITADHYEEAWNKLLLQWLPQSGYQLHDLPCFELYLNNPEEHPEKKHIVDIYIPVKPH